MQHPAAGARRRRRRGRSGLHRTHLRPRPAQESNGGDGPDHRLRLAGDNTPRTVGMFADQSLDEVSATVSAVGLNVAQLCSGESLDYCNRLEGQDRRRGHPGLPRSRPSADDPEAFEEWTETMDEFRAAGHLITLDRMVDGLQGGTASPSTGGWPPNCPARDGSSCWRRPHPGQRGRCRRNRPPLGRGRFQRRRDRRRQGPGQDPGLCPECPPGVSNRAIRREPRIGSPLRPPRR